MFAVDNILVSDELLEAQFACALSACQGACCVQGDSGAPLEEDELEALEEVFPIVRKWLRPEALEVIERDGVWEEVSPGNFATTCVDGGECVFVTYQGPVATCAIQRAHQQNKTDFPKPISCHLYPIRVQQFGDVEALNYEKIEICEPGRRNGARCGIPLADFLEQPLVRKYGEDWYRRFTQALEERRHILGVVA
ncbi:MAG: DUF3109 family protein [Rhodothermales bacterium]